MTLSKSNLGPTVCSFRIQIDAVRRKQPSHRNHVLRKIWGCFPCTALPSWSYEKLRISTVRLHYNVMRGCMSRRSSTDKSVSHFGPVIASCIPLPPSVLRLPLPSYLPFPTLISLPSRDLEPKPQWTGVCVNFIIRVIFLRKQEAQLLLG